MSGYIARKTLVHTTEMLVRRAKFLSHCERTIATSETLPGVFRIPRLSSWQPVQLVGLPASSYSFLKALFLQTCRPLCPRHTHNISVVVCDISSFFSSNSIINNNQSSTTTTNDDDDFNDDDDYILLLLLLLLFVGGEERKKK